MKIATWNVNSLRVRLPHIQDWLASNAPDVLALQETKVVDEDYPALDLEQAGYHSVFSGQKTYNGVAILSREQAVEVVDELPGVDSSQRRFLAATIGKVRVINVYVPNGASVESDKYPYKLDWLSSLTDFMRDELTRHEQLVLLGDFNIAPTDDDVYNPASWEGHVLCTPPERELFSGLLGLGLVDLFRQFEPAGGHWSWWDYRMNAFRRNMGLRIDHILVSQSLAQQATGCIIDKNPRGWERPSDHAPVMMTL